MNTRILVLTALFTLSATAGCKNASRTSNEGTPDTAITATGSTTPASDTAVSAAPVPPAEKSVLLLDTTIGRTGIMGEVRKSPLTKGLPEGQKDYAALPGAPIRVEDVNEVVVARVTSDAAGKFFVALPPGMHFVIPEPLEALYPAPPVSQSIVVPEKGTASVVFSYDTGIDEPTE